jgi:hypothetical protein
MHEELLALAVCLRQATDHIKLTMNRFATIGSDWVDVADRLLKQQGFAGLVRLYEEHSEEPYGLDQPFVWTIKTEVGGGAIVEYGELFRRLGGVLDEQGMMDASA